MLVNVNVSKSSQKLFKLPQDIKSKKKKGKTLSKDELDSLIENWDTIEKKGNKRKL